MNSMEGSLTIPTYVEYKNALVFSSCHLVRTYLKYESEFFVPAGTDLAVKLLSSIKALKLVKAVAGLQK
jgi:hypothetical protein